MKQIKIQNLISIVALFIAACAPEVSAPATVTVIPSATEITTPSVTVAPTSTALPTRTPGPTSTPIPVAVVVTSRPPGNPVPIRITSPIGYDYKFLGIPENLWFRRVAWVADVRVDYGGGIVILSEAASGTAPLVVDDILTIKVLHENSGSDTFQYDFSANSPSGPREAGPFDLTAFFHPGLNMLYVTIYDYGYSYWGTEGLWIVEFR